MTALTATFPLVEFAARNNALWCDAVCKAHGRPGEFQGGLWLNRLGTPRFYPDAVTTAGPDASQQQLAAISALIEAPHTGPWAVKDSFSCLGLGSFGFQSLFEAEWIGLNPSTLEIGALPADCSLFEIRKVSELATWESAWRGDDDQTATGPDERTFPESLLAHHEIHFIAIRRDDRIIGGGILSLGGEVVGLSNVFASGVDPEIIWKGLVKRAVDTFPGMTLVGYESERNLAPALRSGFQTLGPLRVWLSAC
ncbi:hypothetical protein [Microvirga puerhi]|uniref:N-acetyltransferase domain-containing protein n=1 Tax=Microvirga puerhi TaxID=2876078 RepID=A0ABS7VRM2_9HYPH|nr:hypothetical protein [Microvirga puerhi]MBZ6077859.1 hypothetical protein [Microvirga puerhi]